VNQLLAQLDRRLERRGEDIILRKRTISGSTISNLDCTVPAIVRALTLEELVGSISQQNFFIIISPTHLLRAQWPGGRTPATTGGLITPSDPRVPATTDQVVIRGAAKAIQRVAPIFDAGTCVRIELSVLG
jgi:hypothetical protein